ncbi:MAG: hypothetical protein R3D67_14960 [Hyphomicrobiaceae bacterium]
MPRLHDALSEVSMPRLQFVAAALAVCACLGGGALAQHPGPRHHGDPGAASADTRIAVAIPPEMAEHMLANMRGHLRVLEEITSALAGGDTSKAAKVAEDGLGMSSLSLHGAHELSKFMPQGMQEAGTAMHRAASRFAIEAENAGVTGDVKAALVALSAVVQACNGCHAGYRLK